MTLVILGQEPIFPPAENTSPEGIVAIGGDLSPERLINAYRQGIFPWYNEGEPIIWWSPDPRLVLFPKELHISRTLKKLLKHEAFQVTVDRDFPYVINCCRSVLGRSKQTWISLEMIKAYIRLHQLGIAHSIEVWQGNKIVGGLYGISLGKCFFGESMFYTVSNASKYGFIKWVQKLLELNFSIIDCQVKTNHLLNLGAREIPRKMFLKILKEACDPISLTSL